MKKIFTILLSLALVVSLGALTVAPVAAAAPVLPSISPTTANFDLDSPAHLAITLDLGDADDLVTITEGGNPLTPDDEYYVFGTLLVITEGYLSGELTCIGDTVLLQFNFEKDASPFGVAFLTVTAIGTAPGLQSSAEDWNYWTGGDVIVGINWEIATDIGDVSDDVGPLAGGEWNHTLTTLNITNAYLEDKIGATGGGSLGDSVELTVEFDSCDYTPVSPYSEAHTATLTITAVGTTKPSIAPSLAGVDLCDPEDVEFTITWDGAHNISQIRNVTSYMAATVVPGPTAATWTLSGSNTLTFPWYIIAPGAPPASSYAAYCLSPENLDLLYISLEVTFDDPDETIVIISIGQEWAEEPQFGITSSAYTWDIDTGTGNLAALGIPGVGSATSFGCCSNITELWVLDEDGDPDYQLDLVNGVVAPGVPDWLIAYVPGYGYLTIVLNYYLMATMSLGETQVFEATFEDCGEATFSVTATGTQPSISPKSADFNLDEPGNVTTTVTLGPHATSFDITGLTEGVEYTVAADNVTVTITASYLAGVLTAVDDVAVLTFDFDQGDDAKLTITAVGTPLCFIATAAYGSPAAEEINIIREFRDVVLRPNKLGAGLVSLYYEASPPIAEFISQNEALRTAVRVGFIDPIVAVLNWSHGLWS